MGNAATFCGKVKIIISSGRSTYIGSTSHQININCFNRSITCYCNTTCYSFSFFGRIIFCTSKAYVADACYVKHCTVNSTKYQFASRFVTMYTSQDNVAIFSNSIYNSTVIQNTYSIIRFTKAAVRCGKVNYTCINITLRFRIRISIHQNIIICLKISRFICCNCEQLQITGMMDINITIRICVNITGNISFYISSVITCNVSCTACNCQIYTTKRSVNINTCITLQANIPISINSVNIQLSILNTCQIYIFLTCYINLAALLLNLYSNSLLLTDCYASNTVFILTPS